MIKFCRPFKNRQGSKGEKKKSHLKTGVTFIAVVILVDVIRNQTHIRDADPSN